MNKGETTRTIILDQALELASELGLEGLTIGVLAERVGMSKSGLYAHFRSKEELQLRVLDAAGDLFGETVVRPALKKPRGLPRLEALFEGWIRWTGRTLKGGCPFIAACTEFDDREGPVRDRLVADIRRISRIVGRATRIAMEEGHVRDDLDVEQFVFEFWGVMLAHHHAQRLLRRRGDVARARRAFGKLIQEAQA